MFRPFLQCGDQAEPCPERLTLTPRLDFRTSIMICYLVHAELPLASSLYLPLLTSARLLLGLFRTH